MEFTFAGAHPVAVAADRVDFAVVGDAAERLGEAPRREGVGGEAGVDQGKTRGQRGVAQVLEELGQLVGCQHALIYEGLGVEAGDVGIRFTFGAAAQAVGGNIEVATAPDTVAVSDQQLAEDGHGAARGGPNRCFIDGNVAPGNNAQAFLADDSFDGGNGFGQLHTALVGAGKEYEAGRITAEARQVGADCGPKELVRHLQEDPRAVPGVLFRADRAAMIEAF